jgi:hypothetical protein
MAHFVVERNTNDVSWIYLGRQMDHHHCKTHSLPELETIYRLDSTAPTKHVL